MTKCYKLHMGVIIVLKNRSTSCGAVCYPFQTNSFYLPQDCVSSTIAFLSLMYDIQIVKI
jgi:hypothetical protein